MQLSNENRTASYKIIADAEGNRYRFFCERSGLALCTTHPIRAETPEEELRIAWETESRTHFNKCQRCGKWVSDLMFNVETSECVMCSPWEEQPNYCPYCGTQVPKDDVFCRKCGAKLQYKEE